jgi:hypothetical protein
MNQLTIDEKVKLTRDGILMAWSEEECCQLFGISNEDWMRFKNLGITPECFRYENEDSTLQVSGSFYYRLADLEKWFTVVKPLMNHDDDWILAIKQKAYGRLSV